MPGGATGQFSAIPLNIGKRNHAVSRPKASYLVTGKWSQAAYEEALNFIDAKLVVPIPETFNSVPSRSTWQFVPDASYFYFCMNETSNGIDIPKVDVPDGTIVVADASSVLMTRNIDITRYGIIFACAQKNLGIPGVTLVIMRKDLLGHASHICPNTLNYSLMSTKLSSYSVPNIFAIYIMKLMIEYVDNNGGMDTFADINRDKADKIYINIDDSKGFYFCPIPKVNRSKVNIVFRIGGRHGNAELEEKFLEEARIKNYIGLQGDPTVGGLRASLYNSVTMSDVRDLSSFMYEFRTENQDAVF
uniref:Phosphoserine transaminase n=1 Tax=Rhabditophanes sp. KR3021 TaxID=114890 RepID=A0AC35TJK2_9BILA